jgi:capsule polysaccharide export protein KpsE/RkpR
MSIPEKWVRAGRQSVFSSPDLKSESLGVREECVRKDLTQRLKRICENLSSSDFEALIAKMTREQLRGEGVGRRRLRPR